jgi:hypothetical protein
MPADHDTPPLCVWVTTRYSPADDHYFVMVQFSDGSTCRLDQARAQAYATEVLQVATTADHDAAIAKQITTELGMPQQEMAVLVRELRADRLPLDTNALRPLTITPGVSVFTGEPFLDCTVGESRWQWTVADAREHAMHVLGAMAAAVLDTAYHWFLTSRSGLDRDRATVAVAELTKFLSSP